MRKNNGKNQSNLNTRLPHLTTLLPPQTSEQLRQSQAECRRLEGELALSQLALSTATTSASTAQVYSICETQRQRYIQRQIKGQEMVSRPGADLGLVSIPPRRRSWRNSKRLPWGKRTPVASCRAATKHWWDNLGEFLRMSVGTSVFLAKWTWPNCSIWQKSLNFKHKVNNLIIGGFHCEMV